MYLKILNIKFDKENERGKKRFDKVKTSVEKDRLCRIMKHFCDDWIQEWCDRNGWTDWFLERRDYWAFPPHSVMPLPIPKEILLEIKAEKGFSPQEKIWLCVSIAISLTGGVLSYILNCPMPLVLAFAFTAIIVADFELD